MFSKRSNFAIAAAMVGALSASDALATPTDLPIDYTPPLTNREKREVAQSLRVEIAGFRNEYRALRAEIIEAKEGGATNADLMPFRSQLRELRQNLSLLYQGIRNIWNNVSPS